MKSKIKFLLATIMMLVGVTATHAEDITSNIRIDVSTFCTDDNGTVTSYLKDEYTVKEGVVVTFRCLKSWDETVTIYLNGTAVATWPGDAGGSKYVWTAKKDAKINWKGYDQYSANIYLTETSTVDVTGITLDPATADMTVGGETLTLTPTVLPDNATDKTVTWTSSDESVATVANGVVTAVAPGTATITVTTTDGAKTATCTVTVAEPTYTVTVKEGTEDAASWTITPAEATTTGVAAGTEVKATYGGTKKVKSVKAVKKAKPAATVTTAPTAKTGVKAGQDVAIVNEGAAEGGTMMYMVNATQPASTEGFSATVPTAEGLTAGTYYVWYYVKADDSHTDSEISATGIEVTIAAAGPKAAAEATAEDKGKLIGTDGKIYADVAAATAAGTTAVAKIIYLGTTGHATYSHGLALALTDEASTMVWQAAIDACSAKNTSTPVTGATWLLASKEQWEYMMGANGAGSYTALRDGFNGITGASNLQSNWYWSSTEYDAGNAWDFNYDEGDWSDDGKSDHDLVRSCLAF